MHNSGHIRGYIHKHMQIYASDIHPQNKEKEISKTETLWEGLCKIQNLKKRESVHAVF